VKEENPAAQENSKYIAAVFDFLHVLASFFLCNKHKQQR
jgi:hypothetical protein